MYVSSRGWPKANAPAHAYRTFALPKRLIEGGRVCKHPAIQTGMIDINAALLHHFFQLPIADGIRYLPTHTPKDEVPLKRAALEIHDGCFAISQETKPPEPSF